MPLLHSTAAISVSIAGTAAAARADAVELVASAPAAGERTGIVPIVEISVSSDHRDEARERELSKPSWFICAGESDVGENNIGF